MSYKPLSNRNLDDIDDGMVESFRLHLYLSNDEAFRSFINFKRDLYLKDHMRRLDETSFRHLIENMMKLGILYRIHYDLAEDDEKGVYIDALDQGYCETMEKIEEIVSGIYDYDYLDDMYEIIDAYCNNDQYYTFIEYLLDILEDTPGISYYSFTNDGLICTSRADVLKIINDDVFYIRWVQEV